MRLHRRRNEAGTASNISSGIIVKAAPLSASDDLTAPGIAGICAVDKIIKKLLCVLITIVAFYMVDFYTNLSNSLSTSGIFFTLGSL